MNGGRDVSVFKANEKWEPVGAELKRDTLAGPMGQAILKQIDGADEGQTNGRIEIDGHRYVWSRAGNAA